MRRKTRTKLKKGLVISGIVIGIILIIIGIFLIIKLSQKPEISYNDGIVGKNYFTQITIDLNTKEVKRDNIETTLVEEFGISPEHEAMCLNSKEEMNNLLVDSIFDISVDNQIFTIKNPYQTKKLIVKAEEIKEKVEGEEIEKVADNLHILSFYSEKLTKAMYKYYKEQDYIQEIYIDEIYIDEPVNDISQTMYGETEISLGEYHSLGALSMGLDNYNNIINENGNGNNVIISTIGYGINYQNEFFENRIDEKYHNFILNDDNISETIPQGSRIAEILVDSTTPNVQILPLVTVTEEGYTSISSIINAICFATENSDVICYELINNKHKAIDMVLENAFSKNVPVCTVSVSENENYPANHAMTIATSSIDRNNVISDYSGKGEYIDFSAPSTDIEEIFNKSSSVSRWSGPQYSNAQIVAAISLIKTYDKEATILDIYNFLRNYSEDLGKEGKDESYGYGCPNFKELKISDLDKISPEIKEIKYQDENWETVKKVKIVADDNIRVKSWAVTKNQNGPNQDEWQVLENITPNIDVEKEIIENGTYYVWVQDTAGNTVNDTITITKVDSTPPQIAYVIDKNTLSSGYVTINVTAEDVDSGLGENPFSWDNRVWSLENSTRTIKENGRYVVYAKDNLENVSEKEILVDCFPQAGTAETGEGNIIKGIKVSSDWTGTTNNNIEITLNKDIKIIGWQITTSSYAPRDFVSVQGDEIDINREMNMQSTTNTVNTSVPDNVVLNSTNNTNSLENVVQNILENTTTANNTTNTNSAYTEEIVVRPRTEPIVINTQLEADTPYFLWIKDSTGNVNYQTFTIHKAEI